MKNDYLNTLEESDMLLRDDFELEFDKQRNGNSLNSLYLGL